MKLKVAYGNSVYLFKVVSVKNDFKFFYKNRDNLYDYNYFSFQKFTCSLECRLKHYKDFKSQIFGNCWICNSYSKCGNHLDLLTPEKDEIIKI